MPEQMTEEELELHFPKSQKLEAYEYGDLDVGDYIIAELRKCTDGRHFRYIESSGMDSIYSGAGEFGEWLTPAEVKDWKEFEA